MGRLSWISGLAQCNHKCSYTSETGGSQFVAAEVTMEAKGWSEARKEPKTKEGRQLLKAKNGPKTDSAWKLLEGTEP